MIHCFVKPTIWIATTNAGKRALLGLVCCFVMAVGLLITSDVHAFSKGDKVMVQNNEGLNVREHAGLAFDRIVTVSNDAMGTIEDGPVPANGVDRYQMDWETPSRCTSSM